MTTTEHTSGHERRARDRAAGILLRRRQKKALAKAEDRRRDQNGFDIAAALELHLDQVTTRRGMIALLESWQEEAKRSAPPERDERYIEALMHATEVMRTAPDPLTGIAILQRASE